MKKRLVVSGFTLVEMMVAVAVFATASVILTDLFLIGNRAQRRADASQAIQSDARQALNTIADRIRAGKIDFATQATQAPLSNSTPVQALYLIDEHGNRVLIGQNDAFPNYPVSAPTATKPCPSATSTPCLVISEDGGVTFSDLTSARVKLVGSQGLKFYVQPIGDPSSSSSGFNTQPRVTVVLGLQGLSSNTVEQGTTYVQTTASSRVLLR